MHDIRLTAGLCTVFSAKDPKVTPKMCSFWLLCKRYSIDTVWSPIQTIGWVNWYQTFEIEKYTVCGKLILQKI